MSRCLLAPRSEVTVRAFATRQTIARAVHGEHETARHTFPLAGGWVGDVNENNLIACAQAGPIASDCEIHEKRRRCPTAPKAWMTVTTATLPPPAPVIMNTASLNARGRGAFGVSQA